MKRVNYKEENGLRYFSIYEVWGERRETGEYTILSRFLSKEEAIKDKEMNYKLIGNCFLCFWIMESIVWAN